MFDTIKNGIALEYIMQPFDNRLSDEAISNVIWYLRHLHQSQINP